MGIRGMWQACLCYHRSARVSLPVTLAQQGSAAEQWGQPCAGGLWLAIAGGESRAQSQAFTASRALSVPWSCSVSLTQPLPLVIKSVAFFQL